MLQVQNIEKYYGNKNNVTKALDRVSLNVEAGEFLAIMGASGSGKTTLLNCISTIDTISAGKILLDGVSVADLSEAELAKFRRERLGFVFQDFNLLDTLTIEENIGLALSLNHEDAGAVRSRVREVARRLGITDILEKFPYQVSGGQKQRTAVARAIGAVSAAGRRAHRGAGFQGLEKSAGDYDPDESGLGGHHPHGHPRRLQRQLRQAGSLSQGRTGVQRASPGRPGQTGVLSRDFGCAGRAGG